jgi:hypothetical protein
MCGSPYDYCVPAYTQRTDDYRGCNVFYRAGSVFWNNDACCDGMGVDFVADQSMNFGTTTPVDLKRPTPRTLGPRKTERATIGIPSKPATLPSNDAPSNDFKPFEEQIPSSPDLPTSPPPTLPRSFDPPMPFDQTQNQRGPLITIEELRRLDPTVTDIRILNVEDAPNPKTGSQIP